MNKQAMYCALGELTETVAQLRAAGACKDVLDMLELARARLQLQISQSEMRWYLFDGNGCIGDYERAVTAAAEAQRMADAGVGGIQILHLSNYSAAQLSIKKAE